MSDYLLEKTREINAHIAKLTQTMAELTELLAKAADLQRFEPRAFSHGGCKTGGKLISRSPFEAVWTLTLGNGEVIERDALDVPKRFWPPAMASAYDDLPKWQRPKLRAGE